MNSEDDFVPVSEILNNNDKILKQQESNEGSSDAREDIIDINRLFTTSEDEKSIKENESKDNEKQKLIQKIQIGLIIFLFVSAIIVYFFGYNIIEPFIKLE